MKVKVEKQIGESTLSFEAGQLAKQAAGCVIVQYGETVVLCATATGTPRPGIDFFPLTCDYRERTAAAGKFPGGFIKREGRPTTKEILTSRLIDRPIRPMFAEGFKNEVQCQAMVVASDKQNDGDVLAMNGAAAALFISSMPFEQAVASCRVGRIDGKLVAFPTHEQLEESELDIIVSGTADMVTMIEGFGREVPEDVMFEAIEYSHEVIKDVIGLMQELQDKVGTEKMDFQPPESDGLLEKIKAKYYDQFREKIQTAGKQERAEALKELRSTAMSEMIPDPEADNAYCEKSFKTAWHDLEEIIVRELILAGKRADGRGNKDIRAIECMVDVLPRVHGSAVFQRGETQSLITVTLGTGKDEQRVDGLMDEYSKKFMLDYNFPSFSVGECRPNRGPGRREIGHGALAERSIKSILPDPEDFPYTIRVISDILESNGSSSMATVCGTTLGLMSAGVKIQNPVAGISVGMVQEGDDYALITDILGSEDHFGDMDFKIAGTQNGITGIQLDLKIRGVNSQIIRETLEQSKEARLDILKTMLSTIRQPSEEISPYAPRLLTTKIPADKIGMLIGPGGKNIRAIQEATETVIEIEEDGKVTIACADAEMGQKALEKVEACTATVQVGKIYNGTVSSVKDFGAFVEILPGRDGLCHISELSNGFIDDVSQVCQVGDEIKVLCIGVDDHDRVKLSRRQALVELGEEDEFAQAETEDAADTEEDNFDDDYSNDGGSDFEDDDDFDGDDFDDDGDDDRDRGRSDRGGRGRGRDNDNDRDRGGNRGGGNRGGGGGRGRSGGGDRDGGRGRDGGGNRGGGGRGRSGGGGRDGGGGRGRGRSGGGGGGRGRSGGGDRDNGGGRGRSGGGDRDNGGGRGRNGGGDRDNGGGRGRSGGGDRDGGGGRGRSGGGDRDNGGGRGRSGGGGGRGRSGGGGGRGRSGGGGGRDGGGRYDR